MEESTVATMSGRDESLEQEVQKQPERKEEIIPKAQPEPVETNEEAFVEPKPEDELWEGGPTFATINGWKQQFGDGNIYVTSVNPTKHIVWRTISRFEYKGIVKQLEESVSNGLMTQAEANMNNEELITQTCILYPKVSNDELMKDLAGVASILSQEILEASAFIALDIRRL